MSSSDASKQLENLICTSHPSR